MKPDRFSPLVAILLIPWLVLNSLASVGAPAHEAEGRAITAYTIQALITPSLCGRGMLGTSQTLGGQYRQDLGQIPGASVAVLFPSANSPSRKLAAAVQELHRTQPEVRRLYERASRQSKVPLDTLLLLDFKRLDPSSILLAHVLYVIALYETLTKNLGSSWRPQVLAGQSIGALAAMVVSGSLSLEEAVGIIMGVTKVWGLRPFPVALDTLTLTGYTYETIKKFIQPGKVELLHDAGPAYLTLAVKPGADLNSLLNSLAQAGVPGANVHYASGDASSGWHTSWIAELRPAIGQIMDAVHLQRPRIPLQSSSRPGVLITSADEIQNELEAGLLQPVYWRYVIDTLTRSGINLFLDLGSMDRFTGWNRVLSPATSTAGLYDCASVEEFASRGTRMNGVAEGRGPAEEIHNGHRIITLDRAAPGDFEQLARLNGTDFWQDMTPDERKKWNWNLNTLYFCDIFNDIVLNGFPGVIMIAKMGEEIVGHCFALETMEEGWIYNLVVKREMRRSGIGGRLFAEILAALKQRSWIHTLYVNDGSLPKDRFGDGPTGLMAQRHGFKKMLGLFPAPLWSLDLRPAQEVPPPQWQSAA